jgi:voltage-gated potassium channel
VILLVVAGVFWLFEKDHIQDESGGDFSYLDSLYFTIVTVTTVGYGDIVPVTEEARMFDAFIITPIRILVWIMMIGTAYQLVMQNQWEDFKVNRILKKMKDHIIIVGYGSTGVATLKELRLYKFPENKLVVIDKMEPPLGTAADIGAIGVLGDASSEDTLLLAGIKRASIIIVTTPKDDSNVMITLTAKDLNSRVKIITRVSERENIKQLKRAGADVIISPSLTSGNLMAMAVANSNSVELIEDLITTSRGVNVIQRKITQSEVGKSPKTLKGFITIGIVRKGKNIGPRELDGEVLKQGDDIIYIG